MLLKLFELSKCYLVKLLIPNNECKFFCLFYVNAGATYNHSQIITRIDEQDMSYTAPKFRHSCISITMSVFTIIIS